VKVLLKIDVNLTELSIILGFFFSKAILLNVELDDLLLMCVWALLIFDLKLCLLISKFLVLLSVLKVDLLDWRASDLIWVESESILVSCLSKVKTLLSLIDLLF